MYTYEYRWSKNQWRFCIYLYVVFPWHQYKYLIFDHLYLYVCINIDLYLHVCINTDDQNVKCDLFYARYLCSITRSTVVLQRICLTENLSYREYILQRMPDSENVSHWARWKKISDAEKLFTDNVSDRECPTLRLSKAEHVEPRMSNTENKLAESVSKRECSTENACNLNYVRVVPVHNR